MGSKILVGMGVSVSGCPGIMRRDCALITNSRLHYILHHCSRTLISYLHCRSCCITLALSQATQHSQIKICSISDAASRPIATCFAATRNPEHRSKTKKCIPQHCKELKMAFDKSSFQSLPRDTHLVHQHKQLWTSEFRNSNKLQQ